MRVHGPERSGGQGLDRHQEESGNRAIAALLTDDVVGPQVDLVLTWRAGSDGGAGGADDRADGAYEVWSARGMVRFRRLVDDGGALRFEVLEVLGENPIADQDPLALATIDAERAAADCAADDVLVPELDPGDGAVLHPAEAEGLAVG